MGRLKLVFALNFTKFALRQNSPYSVRMRENKGQKSSEYGHFPHNVDFRVAKSLRSILF